ncbi:MAG TPA: glycosyltransferase family A protein [Gemmatimonadaceae bacterium]
MTGAEPRVTVLTPVYNGEPYLAECIESVIGQRYKNWDYIIVNNCSTDNTLAIATRYAEGDRRIRIVNNETFVDGIANHNIAFSLLPAESKYCKVISADDWIYPECLDRLVNVAEMNPSVGIVSCYALTNRGRRASDVPPVDEVFPGRSVCRMHVLGARILGAPTTVLYRADVVRSRQPFFTVKAPSADIRASLEILQLSDFGFVHQVLCFERLHEGSVSSTLMAVNSFLVDRLDFVVSYGSALLTPPERDRRIEDLLSAYYEFLADSIIHLAGPEFRKYHRDRLADLGYPIDNLRLARAVSRRVIDWLVNPRRTFTKMTKRLLQKA